MSQRSTFGLFRRYVWLLLLAGVVAAAVYWWRFSPVPVQVHTVGRETVLAEVFGTGTLEAKTRAVVGTQISGRLVEILVEQGDTVKAGQLLARLESNELSQQVEAAQATLSATRAGLERLKADLDRATVVVEQAQRDYDRAVALYESRAQALSVTEKARETLAVAKADRERSGRAIAEAQAQVVAAEKALGYQRARLDYTRIEAPFDALVVLRHRDPGDIVVPGSSILETVALDVLWVSAWVDESQMNRLAPGQPARVVFRSNPEADFAGEVSRLGRQVDRETREFVVDVRVKSLPDNWAVGQRAEVYIETGRREDVVTIPAAFLVRRGEALGAWRLEDGRARWRPVTPGLRAGGAVEIREGLSAGDRVVAARDRAAASLSDGRSVSVP